MKQTFDLAPLAADYDIIGELDDAAGGRTYIATRKGEDKKRRDDQTGVLITVVSTPEGDEANALSHLAADTKLLAGTSHRRLVPVLEGRWLGDDAFAVVTQRCTDPSLAQRLASGETFTNTRIAAILREVNGLLEWAREQKIVHRSIPAARVFLEPKTDRVRVTFTIAPILRLHRADDRDDARTIARLASAMLTGDVDPRAHEGQTLAELRPDLPERLGEATAALLDEKRTDVAPDVAAYLALIGMADPVAAGEAERERIRAEILEEQRAEREKLATERASFERTMAEERATFERTMAEERAKLEAERSALQERATSERDALQRAVAEERAQLAAKRAELERVVAGQRAELERAAAADRAKIEALREELRQAGEREIEKKRETALEDIVDSEDVLDQRALATPVFVPPVLVPLAPLEFAENSPLMRRDEIVFAPEPDESTAADEREAAATAGLAGRPNRRRWIVSGSAAALLLFAGIGAAVLASRRPATARATRPPAPVSAPAPVVQAPAVQAPATSAPAPAAAVAVDSASIRTAARWLDSLKEEHPVELPAPRRIVREVPVERAQPAQREVPSITEDPFFIPGSPTPRRDTTVPRDTLRRPDTTTPPPA